MRYMGLDIGDATIGIALSDPFGIIAQGHENYRRVSTKEDIAHLVDIIVAYEVTMVVAGLPLNMNGTSGPQAEKVRLLTKQIEKKLKFSDKLKAPVPVELWDERLSTVQAERMMIEADLSRARRRQIVDKMAAIVILQSFLDSKGHTIGGHLNE